MFTFVSCPKAYYLLPLASIELLVTIVLLLLHERHQNVLLLIRKQCLYYTYKDGYVANIHRRQLQAKRCFSQIKSFLITSP